MRGRFLSYQRKRRAMNHLTHETLDKAAADILAELHARALAGKPESLKPETTLALAKGAAAVSADLFPDLDAESRIHLCRAMQEMIRETPDDRTPACTRLDKTLARFRENPGPDERTTREALVHALILARSIVAGCKSRN